ncbi:MAG: hypothetical protein ACI4SY_02820 [Sutterella sp.]
MTERPPYNAAVIWTELRMRLSPDEVLRLETCLECALTSLRRAVDHDDIERRMRALFPDPESYFGMLHGVEPIHAVFDAAAERAGEDDERREQLWDWSGLSEEEISARLDAFEGSVTQALIDLIQVDGGVTAASVINLGYAHLALGELPSDIALRAYSEGSDEGAAGFARLCAYCLVSVGQNIIESGVLAEV